jgi:hypothetical protein
MRHYTCDFCGKDIPPDDHRYVVKIEVYPPRDPAELTDEDLDEDHLEIVGQQLRDEEDGLVSPEIDNPRRSFLFDLCPVCQKKYVRDPLSKEVVQKFDFSEN